jgi:hypothetical protein
MVNDYKANARPHDPTVWVCMTLTGPNGEKNRTLFLEQGADIIATDVNALLGYLKRVRERSREIGNGRGKSWMQEHAR